MGKIKPETRTKRKYQELVKLFSDLPGNKRELCDGLLREAAHMAVMLEDLRKQVLEDGPLIVTKNGNGFEVLQEHPAQKSYLSMISRYSTVVADLNRILPEGGGASKLSAFLESDE